MTRTAKNCVFCDRARLANAVFLEDEYFVATFDQNPVNPGHALLIPKRHVVSLFDLDENEWRALKPVLVRATKTIEATDLRALYLNFFGDPKNIQSKPFYKTMLVHIGLDKKPQGYNIGVNEGTAAGRTIDHLHIHIIPRYAGDKKDVIGGIRSIFPDLRTYQA